jgi:hypothetical protein
VLGRQQGERPGHVEQRHVVLVAEQIARVVSQPGQIAARRRVRQVAPDRAGRRVLAVAGVARVVEVGLQHRVLRAARGVERHVRTGGGADVAAVAVDVHVPAVADALLVLCLGEGLRQLGGVGVVEQLGIGTGRDLRLRAGRAEQQRERGQARGERPHFPLPGPPPLNDSAGPE